MRKLVLSLAVLLALFVMPTAPANAATVCKPGPGVTCVKKSCDPSAGSQYTVDGGGSVIYCASTGVWTADAICRTPSSGAQSCCITSGNTQSCANEVCDTVGATAFDSNGLTVLTCTPAISGSGSCSGTGNFCTWVSGRSACTPSGNSGTCVGNICKTLGLTQMDADSKSIITCLLSPNTAATNCSTGQCAWKSMSSVQPPPSTCPSSDSYLSWNAATQTFTCNPLVYGGACPQGYVLGWNGAGILCVPTVADITCSPGSYVSGFSGGQPICKTPCGSGPTFSGVNNAAPSTGTGPNNTTVSFNMTCPGTLTYYTSQATCGYGTPTYGLLVDSSTQAVTTRNHGGCQNTDSTGSAELGPTTINLAAGAHTFSIVNACYHSAGGCDGVSYSGTVTYTSTTSP